MTNPHWYLIYTKYNREFVAAMELKKQEYVSYCPMVQNSKGRCDPMYKRYIFAYLTPGVSDFRTIDNTYGVSNIIKFGVGNYAAVPDELIETLKQREQENDYGLIEVSKELKVGDPVTINHVIFTRLKETKNYYAEQLRRDACGVGEFNDWDGIIMGINKNKAKVQVDEGGKMINIPLDNLEPAT